MATEGTLISELVTRARRKANDERSRRWRTDEPILEQMSHARRKVVQVFGRLTESGFFETVTAETLLAANATQIVLPADFMGVKDLALVLDPVALGGTGRNRVSFTKIKRQQQNGVRTELPVAVVGDRPGYWVRRGPGATGKVAPVLPVSSQARYYVLTYHHTFEDIAFPIPADPNNKINTPTEFDELIVLYTAICLCENDRKIVDPLKLEFERLKNDLITSYEGAEDETGVEQVDDDWHREFNSGVM